MQEPLRLLKSSPNVEQNKNLPNYGANFVKEGICANRRGPRAIGPDREVPSGRTGRVLVIGDDMRIFLSLVRSLGRSGKEIHAAPFSTDAPALKSRYISKIHPVPKYDDCAFCWRVALLELLRKEPFDLVIPCTDPAIMFLDECRQELINHILAIPDREAMLPLFDKGETHLLCERLGIPMARASRLTASASVDSLIIRHEIPFVLKPRRSFWADGRRSFENVEIIENREQLGSVLASIPDRSRYLAESYFEGSGVGVSVLSNGGKILQSFQHRRLREGKGGCSSYRISEPVDPTLRHACEKICGSTAYTGVCMFEFRVNQHTGEWVLLEINARFWGSMSLPLSLGINFPDLLYELKVHARQMDEKAYCTGVRSRNVMLDGYNLLRRLRETTTDGIASWLWDVADYALQPVRWLTRREHSDSFVRDDLFPAVWEFVALLRERRNGHGSSLADTSDKTDAVKAA